MNNKESYNSLNNKKSKSNNIALYIFYVFMFLFFIFFGYSIYVDRFSVYLMSDEITIDKNTNYIMELLPKNSNLFNYDNYIFESENSDIAVVDKYGQITGVNQGQVFVSVKYKYDFEKEKLLVKVDNVNIEKISTEKTIKITKNDTQKVKVSINDQLNIEANINYEIKDNQIAKVDEFGNLTGLRKGNTTLIVSTDNGLKKEINIIVEESKDVIQQLSIKQKAIKIKVGDEKSLKVETIPSNADLSSLSWISENPTIAKVNSNGKVTGVSAGETKIIVKNNNDLDSICLVNVSEDEEIILNTYNETIKVGQSFTIKTNQNVTFSSKNEKIATVTKSGVVKGIKEGTTTIIAKTKTKSASMKIIVKKEDKKQIETVINKIVLNKTNLTIIEGSSEKITADVLLSNVKDKSIIWTSANSKIASVDQNGLVKALSPGSTKIIVTSKNNSQIKAELLVKVNAKSIVPSKLTLDKSKLELNINSSSRLVATISPDDAINKEITWVSSNPKVATVSTSGVVKGIKEGNATIKASTSNGKTATCKITIKKPIIPVSKVVINSVVTQIKEGESISLLAIVEPSNASDKSVTWKSSDSTVASVSSTGVVNAIKEGSAKITVTSNSNKKALASITIIVRKSSSISLNKKSLTLSLGESQNVIATVSPNTSSNNTITWVSSNPKVATVTNGTIKAISKGEAIISAKISNGKSASVNVKVEGYIKISTFGAKCNGNSDDTTAIANAFKYAYDNGIEEIKMGNGNCKTTQFIQLYCKTGNMTITGNATIKHHNILFLVIGSNCKKVKIKNITSISTYDPKNRDINSDGKVDGGDSITHIAAARNDNLSITLDNVTLDGSVTGLSLNNLKSLTINNCTFKNMKFVPEYGRGGYGVLVQGANNVKITNTKFIAGPFFRHAIYISVSNDYPINKNVVIDNCTFDYSGLKKIDYTKYNYPKDKMYSIDKTHIWSPDTSPVQIRRTEGLKIINSTFKNSTSAVVLLGENGPIKDALLKDLILDSPVYRPSEFNNGIYVKASDKGRIEAVIDNFLIKNSPGGIKYATVFNDAKVVFKNVPSNSPNLVDLGYGTSITGFNGIIER